MHLADVFIQSELHWVQVCVWSVHVLLGNQTHDLGIATTMLYCFSYRNTGYNSLQWCKTYYARI